MNPRRKKDTNQFERKETREQLGFRAMMILIILYSVDKHKSVLRRIFHVCEVCLLPFPVSIKQRNE
jgi:hypothetical protein